MILDKKKKLLRCTESDIRNCPLSQRRDRPQHLLGGIGAEGSKPTLVHVPYEVRQLSKEIVYIVVIVVTLRP